VLTTSLATITGMGLLPRRDASFGVTINYAVLFSGSLGDGIEMVQALDEAHAIDMVKAMHTDAQVKAVPAASIEGMDKHRLLFDWLDRAHSEHEHTSG
jgi:hypothetical protein